MLGQPRNYFCSRWQKEAGGTSHNTLGWPQRGTRAIRTANRCFIRDCLCKKNRGELSPGSTAWREHLFATLYARVDTRVQSRWLPTDENPRASSVIYWTRNIFCFSQRVTFVWHNCFEQNSPARSNRLYPRCNHRDCACMRACVCVCVCMWREWRFS